MSKHIKFEQFIRARFERDDWGSYMSADRSKLVRKRILEACKFPRSSFYQDVVIKRRLNEVEANLRRLGILQHLEQERESGLVEESTRLNPISDLENRLGRLQERILLLRSSVEDVQRLAQKFK